ncbi:MAG: extracellular solute-binding protein [Planctomycetota bacterium]|jgi:microcin C transport system substrate-binding protein
MRKFRGLTAVLVLALVAGTGCKKKEGESGAGAGGPVEMEIIPGEVIQKPWEKYKGEIPDLKFGALGEWQSNDDFEPWGDPKAIKGGTLRMPWTTYPTTLRSDGPNSNLMQTREIWTIIYETLIGTHPVTMEFIPSLANEWKISKDKRTFSFRIDKRARFWDGTEVTAEDVVATWEHLTNPDRKDPYNVIVYGNNFEKPVAEDKYTVTVKTKKLNWRLFLYFGGMYIYPARDVRIPGEKYLEDYQWKLMMGSGPYMLDKMVKQESFTLKRRDDYWGKDDKANVGLYNFDKIKWIVVRDRELQYEKFKKGELDFYVVGKAQRWVEEMDYESVNKGWIQKRKIFTESPIGFSGFAYNMRKPPFDDIRVRKAFAHLFNREKLMDKLFFNQYEFTDSYYPGRVWGNPDNPKIRYNPEKAAKLLAEAGWKERNEDGWLVDGKGKIFEVTLEYFVEDWKRIWTVVQEDFRKAGIKFELAQVDWRTTYKKVGERNFTITWQNWGAILFPNPESSWMSELADKPNNNNLPGYKNKRVDELSNKEKETFDLAERVRILREVDSLIFKEHPYALGWHSGYTRVLYWYYMDHPGYYFYKTGDSRSIKTLWWFDPEKRKALEAAMKAG